MMVGGGFFLPAARRFPYRKVNNNAKPIFLFLTERISGTGLRRDHSLYGFGDSNAKLSVVKAVQWNKQ